MITGETQNNVFGSLSLVPGSSIKTWIIIQLNDELKRCNLGDLNYF